ncbi:MAG: UDP-N-acetylglucosamine--N-acetylmuramyl-(pentapeptide) pyrophosphoryl-undecaprenol N-acetylglucosamine transferase [Patescibacteria group bacterium]
MRIIFSGGGTMGSVSPLIAIFEQIKKQEPQSEFLWVATKDGPETTLISSYQIPIKKISAGKLRRYFSIKNLFDPFLVMAGFLQSLFIISRFKPQVVISAGGFVCVPLIWAAWLLRRPTLIHQQDIEPGLANKLMAPVANIITVTFEKSLADFGPKKTVWVGNPFRPDILEGNKEEGYKFFNFDPAIPTILITGGGTGAAGLNDLVLASVSGLVQFCQVIHLTGGRTKEQATHSRYRSYDFLTDQLKNAYAISDLVISRAGLATLTELVALKKPAIIIPMARSHQEKNALEFFRNNAVAMLSQEGLTPESFVLAIKQLLFDSAELNNLSRNIAKMMPLDATEKIIKMIS